MLLSCSVQLLLVDGRILPGMIGALALPKLHPSKEAGFVAYCLCVAYMWIRSVLEHLIRVSVDPDTLSQLLF